MSLDSEIDNIVEPILAAFNDRLQTVLAGRAVNMYLRTSAEIIEWGKTKLKNRPIFYEGPPIKQAIKYTNKHCAKMVTKINEETKERMRGVIKQAIKDKKGVEGLAREIHKEFADMSKYRSELIAKTETRSALFSAFAERGKDMGVTGKQWVLGAGGEEGNCEFCLENAAVGVIPMDEEFPNPQDEIHPGCTCGIAPVMIK